MNIKGVKFKKFISEIEIKDAIRITAKKLNNDYRKDDNVLVIVVMNGSMFFAADLLRELNFEPEITSTKIKSYDGFTRKGIHKDCEIDAELSGRPVIIIEDIVDSGNTMSFLLDKLFDVGVADAQVVTMLFKPDVFDRGSWDWDPQYPLFYIDEGFVVGYGLDYDGYGRNLKDIWIRDE